MSLGSNHDVQRLRDLSLDWLARKLSIKNDELFCWIDAGDDRFQPPRYADCSGKRRLLDVPFRKDRQRFKRLNEVLQWKHLHHRCAHGGVRGCSPFTSARKHLGANCIVTTDIQDCFPNVTAGKFESELSQLHLESGLVQFLSKLVLCRDRIPQGCPTSNIALNLFFWRFDHWLEGRCLKQRLAYSRVADDIVISGENPKITLDCAIDAHARLSSMGLCISDKKWIENGIQFFKPEMLVHSLSVEGLKTRISTEHHAKILQLLEAATGACRSVQAISFLSCVRYRQKLHGWSNYAGQASDPVRSQIKRVADVCDQNIVARLRKDEVPHSKAWWTPKHALSIHLAWKERVHRNSESSAQIDVGRECRSMHNPVDVESIEVRHGTV